jgi:uncharacterized protein YndB with AHSA1/START domain
MNSKLVEPDLSDRPHDTRVERVMRASSHALYESFTTGWEGWFALEGALVAAPVVNGQLFFVVEHEGKRHPHYGRFLALEPDRRVELTWLTGIDGTQGAETVLSVDLEPRSTGCALTLTHRGFYDHERADHHGKSWEQILVGLDKRLTGERQFRHAASSSG